MQKATVILFSYLTILQCISCSEFRYGRATFYGNEPWYWSIHYGSCGYGYLCKEEGTGWDVVALADTYWNYAGSCGRCYEVQCHPTYFTDGYGQRLDRTTVCRDPWASVVVSVTDTCPCVYAANAYSNKRWCCGDMDHFDLSVYAFEKLSEHRWGVIGIKYREVLCDYQPVKVAPVPPEGEHWGEEPEAYGQSCPQYNFPVYKNIQHEIVEQNVQQETVEQNVVEPETLVPETVPATKLYTENGQGQFWLNNWNAEVWEIPGVGLHGGHGICGLVHPGGAISLRGEAGTFDQNMIIEFWTRTIDGIANAAINIQGRSQGCHPLMFQKLQAVQHTELYSQYSVALSQFMSGSHELEAIANPSPFLGCNGMSVEEIQRVSFHNYENHDQFFCIDEVSLTVPINTTDD